MKSKIQISLFLFFVAIVFFSCKTSYDSKHYDYVKSRSNESFDTTRTHYYSKVIVIENDSVLTFFVRQYYGIGGKIKSVKYGINDNNIIVDSLDTGEYLHKIFGNTFTYYKDSITADKVDEVYLNRKYLERTAKKYAKEKRKTIRLIIDDRVHKLTRNSTKKTQKKFDYILVELDKEEAKRLYRIDEKYTTLKLVPRPIKLIPLPTIMKEDTIFKIKKIVN